MASTGSEQSEEAHGSSRPDSFDLALRLKTPVWVYDIDRGRIVHANAAACRLWRAENEEELGQRDLLADMSPTVATRLRQYQRDFRLGDVSFSELWTLYPAGQPASVQVNYLRFILDDGRVAMLCEVTGEPDDEPHTLRSAEALLHTDVLISLYSDAGEPLYMNPAALAATADARGTLASQFVERGDYDEMMAESSGDAICRRVALISTVDGERWHDLTFKRTRDASTGGNAVLVTAVDVSELKTARDRARYLADRDQLTGCFNRGFLAQRLRQVIGEVGDDHRVCAVLFFDIDHFKHVNDRFGHETGDALLRAFAQRVRGQIRESDIMARIGGDEFIVLIEDVRDEDAVRQRLDAIQREICRPLIYGKQRVEVTASIGVSVIGPDTACDWSELIKRADIALYESKREGRDRYTFFSDSLGSEVAHKKWLETELEKSIEKHHFELHYQPRIDMVTGTVVSAEALLRWHHPERGLILPDAFITLSENTGVIRHLGSFVLQRSREQLEEWRRSGLDLDLSLNVSPIQFDDAGLLGTVSTIAAESPELVTRMELEITESSFLGHNKQRSSRIHSIAELGFRLALDDFGTGYSNLAYIAHYPLRCIKLDKIFVEQLPDTGPLLQLILALAREIGAITVAEGVESVEQLAWLVENGCDQVQGYLFSRPLPDAEFRASIGAVESRAKKLLDRHGGI